MTIYTSQMVNQMMAQQTAMFAGQAQYANMIGMRQIAPPTGAFDVSARQTGMFGEQVAAGMMGAARGMAGVGMAGLGVAGALSGIPFDPISAAFAGGSAGMRFGLGGAMLGAGAAALPMMAVTSYAGALGQNFASGFQDQLSLNSTLRNNFQFFGGSGPMGRGFSQQQMGSIGNVVAGQLRSNPFTSSGELNQLIAGGADMGLFSNTRDVQAFAQNFRRMISTLRDVQRELGGSLQEAQNFVRQSQQSGIYNSNDQAAFAARIRTAVATTGMNQEQVMQLSSMGASMARAAGGRGYQGAFGAARAATQLGSAIQGGYLSQELLSEATGGLQGSEAVQAFTMRMMGMTDRFSRSGAGRYMTFALSNERGDGIDQEMMARMRAGDISVSEIRQRAQRNVNQMGRARALNQEGFLRGAQMEQGGMSGQLAYLRMAMGDQIEDPGSERAQYFMRRRFGLSQTESQVVSQLMRNQGNIALGESITNVASSREAAYNREVSENRSFEAFTRHLEHGISDSLGTTRARELGRTFATRISSAVERGFNVLMGMSEEQLGRESQMSLARLSVGRASGADRERVRHLFGTSGTSDRVAWNADSTSPYDSILHGLGLHTRGSVTDQMVARGDRKFGGLHPIEQMQRVMSAGMAQRGFVEGTDRAVLEQMMGNRPEVLRDITQAQMRARGAGHSDSWYQYMRGTGSGNANAADAYLYSIGAAGAQGAAPGLEQGGSGTEGMYGRLRRALLPQDLQDGPEGEYGRAMRYLSHGGSLGTSIDRRIQALGKSDPRHARLAQIDVGGILTRGLGGHEEEALRTYRSSLNVSREDLQGILGEGTFGNLYRSTLDLEGGSAEAMSQSMASLREEALRMEGPQREAAQSLIQGMEHSYSKYGRFGSEYRAVARDPGQMQAARRQMLETAAQYRSLGSSLSGVQGLEGLGSLLTGVSSAYQNGGENAFDTIQNNMFEFNSQTARLSDADRSRAFDVMGRTEEGRLLMQGVTQFRQTDRDLSGRGRRGARGARDTAAELISGGTIGDMEFEVGGRRRTGRQGLEEAMRRDPTRAREQYIEQMQLSGVDSHNAGKMFDVYRSASEGREMEGGRRVQFSQAERDALQRVAGETGVAEAQQRRSVDQARAANPLMAEVSRTLGEIRDRLPPQQVAQDMAQVARDSRGFLSNMSERLSQLGGLLPGGE